VPNNYFEKEKYYWGKVFLDGLFLFAAFLLIYYMKRGHIQVEDNFKKFLPLLIITWFLVTLFSKKFKQHTALNFYSQIKTYVFSVLFFAALLSFELYILGWYFLSRFIVYFTIGAFLIFEILFLAGSAYFKKNGKKKTKIPFSMVFFYTEFLILCFILSAVYFYSRKNITFQEGYPTLILGVGFVWILISLLIHKYEINREEPISKALYPFWKSELIIILIVSFFLLVANLASFSQLIVLGSLAGFAILENLIVVTYYLLKKKQSGTKKTDYIQADEMDEKEKLTEEMSFSQGKIKYGVPGAKADYHLFAQKLQNVYLSKYHDLFKYISGIIDLSSIDILHSTVIQSKDISSILALSDNSNTFFLNLAEVNHFRYINKALIKINSKLQQGGVFIGKFQSLEQSKRQFFLSYPKFLAYIFYPFYFIFKRVFPKLPLIRKIYFFLTKGKNRVISKAEMLGRLSFCGFEIIDFREIENYCWFITKKAGILQEEKYPSYGLLFRQKRIGRNGDIIRIYKLRTMYPYSEYIQDYIIEKHHLNDISKIRGDFRITGWGRVLRRLWLDEFPMVFNMIRGEVKLVGVRPLSIGFFKTYPEELQKKRIQYKPGILPPYYADMPEKIEEVWESESIYLDKYSLHPLRTDISYFFRISKNILFYHAKSG